MKNKNLIKSTILVLVLLSSSLVYSQLAIPFAPRVGNVKLKGDAILIGNSIVNRASANNPSEANIPYNGNSNNNNFNSEYIDIDGNGSTFSSSSAVLTLPTTCSKVVYAGLYWAAIYPNNRGTNSGQSYTGTPRTEDWNQMKFRIPGGSYIDITADTGADPVGDEDDIIFNGYNYSNINQSFTGAPYVCYKNVTSLIQSNTNPSGTYFAANIRATRGVRSGGCSGGWLLVVIYEDANQTGKLISTFDGYVGVQGSTALNYNVNGFITLPAPLPVNAKVGIGALEGDLGITGDQFRIKANSNPTFTSLTDAANPVTNFFNSSISNLGVINPNRNPNSTNTLGMDVDLIRLNNPLNSVLPNNETGATLRLETSGDAYGAFFSLFAVEIIEPKIPLIKTIENTAGNNINNQTLALGQEVYYVLNFQNLGNDNAQNLTITDNLPINAIFPSTGTIQPGDVTLPPGVTYTYDPVTKKFVFTIPNNLVEIGDPSYTIRIKVKIPSNCEDFADACSNQVINQAFISYSGMLNTQTITDNPSDSGYDECNFPTPGTTNFIANIDNCVFSRTEILCGNTLNLTGADGYSTYLWQDSSGNTIGNTQTVTVTATGTYTVFLSTPPPCVSIFETVTVVDFNNAIGANPAINNADQVVTCPNDGSLLPKIFLCGENDHELIQSGVNNAVSIVWQQLVTGSCSNTVIANCPNTGAGCTWNTVGTGPNFDATTAGEYQVTFTYQNGCFRQFYFNVYKNVLNPDVVTSNIICNTQGSITINNVPSSYEFSLSPTGPFQISNTFPITTAGTYTVYIRQIGVTNGCTFIETDINILEQILDVDVIVTNKLCNNSFGSIRVQINGVEPQYKYQISQGATVIGSFGPSIDNDHLFSNLNPGTYTINTSTDDGCVFTQQVTIQNLANLELVASVSQHIGCNQGNIQMNPNGGQPPYNYVIYSYNGVPVNPANYDYQTSVIFDIQNGEQGDYQFMVIDSNNCVSLSNIVTINLEPPVTLNETHTNVTCNNLNNGTIAVQTGPTNGYNVNFSIDGGNNFQSSNVFNNLAPGTYTILVRFTKGNKLCDYTIDVTITEPTPLLGQSQVTQQLTCATTGTIQAINVTGGTPSYQYSINGVTFQSGPNFSNLNAGTYVITIKDANNCTFTTAPITFAQPLPPTDLTFTSSSVTCPSLTSNVTTNILGGTAPYMVQITAPSTIASTSISGNSATFNNLTVGTYTFVVTDVNGCTYQENFTINPITFIDITGNLVSNVSCLNGSNGAVLYNVTGFNTTYSYSVNGQTAITNQTSNTIALNNLTAGNYSITVTDSSTNCTDIVSVSVSGPSSALTLNTTISPIKCNANGSFTATASGGWGSYTYILTQPNATTVGPQNNGVFTNQTQTGTYTISVTDANGCIVTNTAVLNTPVSPTLAISPTSTLCYNATTGSTVILTATSGVAPYQYSSGGAFQTNNTFNGLTPGNYTFTVRDSYGCTATVTETITPALLATAVLTKNLDCSASPDAIITLNVNGGTTPYQYQVNINGGGFGTLNPITGSSLTYSTAVAGTYQFLITGANGCTFTTSTITINPITNPDITSITPTQLNLCNGDNNGAITVNINNALGTSPFQYSINGGAFQNSNTFTGLAAGTYSVTVRDSKMCTDNESITLVQPDILTAQSQVTQQLSCIATGTIQAFNVTGGTAPYQYSINGVTFQTSNTFTGLSAGTYTITIRDFNNCTTTTAPITLVQPLAATDLTFTSSSVTCPSLTSNVTATVVGGTAPFVVQINSPSAIPATSIVGNVATFNNLAIGSYTFIVTDANGCTYQENFTINPITFINVTGNLTSNVICFGASNGAATYNVTGFNTTYSYTVNGGTAVTNQTNNTINLTNLAAGTYGITVTDNSTNCQSMVSVTVAQPSSALTLNATTNPISCIANGTINAVATGGWGSYSYTLTQPNAATVGPQSSGVFANQTQTGTYTISVTDGNGCTVTNAVTLSPTVNPTLTISPASTLCYNATTGSTVILTATSGVAPYQYSSGGAFQTNNTFNGLTPGNYTFTVRDSYGCTATVTQTITPTLLAQTAITKTLDCSASPDAVITVNINGGTTPYQYQVNVNGGGFGTLNPIVGATLTYSTAVAGTYQFLITGANGCTFTTSTITINPITNPDITSIAQTQQNLCNGDTNGAIQVNINNALGTSPFQYSINGGAFQNSNTFSGLAAGTYTVIVRDSKLCTDTESITLVQPDAITFDISTTGITCNNPGGTSFGEVIFENVTGGTQPYTYYLSSNFGYSDSYNATLNEDHTFIVLDFGIYTAEVIDFNGCSVLQSNIIIASPPDDLDIDISTATADCTSGGTAIITVSSLVSSGSYEFGILETNTIPYTTTYQLADVGTPETTTFTGLIPGVTYTFVVHDLITDCYYLETATGPISSPSNITTTNIIEQNVTCNGSGDGSISFTFDNYAATTTSVDYEIFFAQSNAPTGLVGNSPTPGGPINVPNFGILAPGTYYILLTENGTGSVNGCTTATPNFTITQSTNPLTGSATFVKNQNCNALGIITATGQFGTAPYQYQAMLSGATAPDITTWAGTTSNQINVPSGSWIVYIKDNNNCIVASNIIVVGLDDEPQITLSIDNACANEGSFVINGIRSFDGIAPYTITVDGNSPYTENATNFTISNLSSGNHTVTITDANGCSDSETITINQVINGNATITVQPSCLVTGDGAIQVTATNGSGTYTFELQDNLGTTLETDTNSTGTFLFNTNLVAGNYNVIISDATLGCDITIPVTLDQPIATLFTTDFENVSCFSGTDGSITVTLDATNTDTPYTYSLFDGTTTSTQNSPIFSNLTAGNYTVTVTSSKNCSETENITISEPNALTLTLSADDFVCNSNNSVNEVTITANVGVGSGTAPYLYSIDGTTFQATNTFTVVDNGMVQNITITVRDNNNCSISEPLTINPLPTITDVLVTLLNPNSILTCANDEEVVVTITGGSGNYTYQLLPNGPIVGPTSNLTETFQLTTSGDYTFEIVDVTTGCSFITIPHTVNPVINATVIADNPIAVNCFGDLNGSFDITVNTYSGAYQYTILDDANNTVATGNSNTSTNPLTLNSLGAGNYSVQIISLDTPFCPATSNVITIGSPVGPLNVDVTTTNDNCNFEAGIITATAQFGTAPYEYQIELSTAIAPTVATWAGTSLNIFNKESGSYIVYVKDNNDCLLASTIVVVDLDLSPIITSLTLVDACANEGSFAIDVVRSEGITPFTVSVDGNAPYTENATNFTISNLLSGIHTITITDANGCSDTETITINQIITGNANITVQPSCDDNDGEIQATATNGSGNYSFELQTTTNVNVAGPNSTGLFTGLGFGNYNVIITDTTLNCEVTIPLTLEQPTPISFTTTKVNVSCNGDSDGSITVNLATSNIDTPYTYSLFDGTNTITQFDSTFTGLLAGNYWITVTSSKNCINNPPVQITISEPNSLTLNLASTEFACNNNNGVNTVTITANAGFGTPPYLYSIDGGTNYQNLNIFTDIVDTNIDQNITIRVKDFNGCILDETITITTLPKITLVETSQFTELACNQDEVVKVNVTGGSGTYTYQLLPNGLAIGPTTNNEAFIPIDLAGTYTIKVIDFITGCSELITYIVDPLDIATVVTQNASPVKCYNGTDGKFEINVSGFTGDYTYNIYNDTNPSPIYGGSGNTSINPLTLPELPITGLPGGNYYVQIISPTSAFCNVISDVINISSPPNPLTLDIQQTSDVTCNNPGLGTITAQATGGTGLLEYELVNETTSTTVQSFAVNSTFSNLNGGTYKVTVRDINLCETSQTITLIVPNQVDATVVVTNANLLCYNATNASVTITATGGQGSYQYTLTNTTDGSISGPQIENVFNNLGAGNYTASIDDGWDCGPKTISFIITEPTQIGATLSLQTALSCDDVNPNNAQLLVTGSGGTPPYQYSINGTTFNSTNTFTVGPGTYQYYVTDSNGCEAVQTNIVTIAPIAPIIVTITASNTTIQCNGDTNASITVNATGGLGNYTYTLLNSVTMAVIRPEQTSNIFASPLGAGSYRVLVKSEGGCEKLSEIILITQPANPLNITNYTVTPVSCNGSLDGKIEFIPSGGTPPYQYAITSHLDQFFDTNTFTNLGVGIYTVIVQDANGCTQIIDVQMTQPDPLLASLNLSNYSPELCEGNNDGSASIIIVGGTAPYSTSLDDDSLTAVYVQGQLQFTNLDSTVEHIVYVKDANGCLASVLIPAGNPVTFTPSENTTYDCTTTAQLQNNVVTVSPVGSQYEYALDTNSPGNYQTSNIYTNLTNGTHIIYVKHTNGCIKPVTFTITNWIPLTETHSQVNILCNGGTGSITANGIGGDGNYQYAISPNFTYISTNTFNNLVAGTYTVKVKDSRNCVKEFTTEITQPTAINPIISSVGQDGCLGDNFGFIQVDISGGVGPYMASFNTTNNYQVVGATNSVFYNNLAGGATYTVYIKDANNCITPIQQTLEPAINLKPIATVVYDCSNNQSTNTVTITINPIYQNDVILYTVNNVSQMSNVFTNVPAGTYTASVQHVANGCEVMTSSFTINQIDAVGLVVTETGLNEITAVASGGVPPYTYVFNGTNTSSNNVFIFSQTGLQNVTVYDANGCEATFDIQTTFYPIEIPNFFTPDGNGFNDYWSPQNIDNFTNIESIIFDRYGREIIRLKLGDSWNGTYEATDLPSGDYWYLVNVNDGTGRSFAGNFTLYR